MPKFKLSILYLELLILGLILLVYSSIKVYEYTTWERTVGEVVDIRNEEVKTIAANVQNTVPVIQYMVEGQLYQLRATLISNFTDLNAGQKVELIYPISAVENARVLSVLGFWLPIPSIIIIVLIYLLGIGILRIIFPTT